MNSNNFFQLVADFQKNIDWLNQVLKGGESESVLIDGVLKPSISKDIADKWGAIQAMVQGRKAYETKASLPETPPAGIVLAEVWNDGANNGLYGWTGTEWLLSNYDRIKSEIDSVYVHINALPSASETLSMIGASNKSQYQTVNFNGTDIELLPIYTDSDGRVCLGLTKNGQVVGLLNNVTTSAFGIESYKTMVGEQGVQFAILDDDGRCLLAFGQDGQLVASSALLTGVRKELGMEHRDWAIGGEYEYVIIDDDNALAFGIKRDGTLVIGGDGGGNLDSPINTNRRKHAHRTVQTDWHFTLVQGQSLSRGWDFSETPALSTTQPYNNMAIPEPNWPDKSATTLTPLIERQEYPWTETVCAGSANQVSFLLDQELKPWDTWSHDQIMACNGVGGAAITALIKGTNAYQDGMDYITTAKQIVDGRGESFGAHGTYWIQGESNNNGNPPGDAQDSEWYRGVLTQLKNDYNTDVMAITGQKDRIPMFTYQTTSHAGSNQAVLGINHWPAASLGQLAASMQDDEMVLVCPIYQFSFSDNGHMDNHGYRHMGHYFGKAYYEWVINSRKFLPLHPTKLSRTESNRIEIKFHVPCPPLRFDTDLVLAAKDYGFIVHDSDDSEIEIKSVRITSQDTVSIITENAIPDDAKVSYARRIDRIGMKGPAGRGGCRGNLRDCDNTLALDNGPDGQPYKLYNWCVFFIENIEI
ncbi:hypothetical protein ACED34_20275 [Vibrio splendidus]|uniref:Phage protein n=1 Tax=Vibrio splendidus TaxID=29497 RepID=A0A0H3ZKH0_VIBSP|nr:Phage protein [Vibrio splendidus]